MNLREIPRAPRQKGAVLIVGLIMLLLMTIVGMAAIRGSGLQEQMAGNMRDLNLAFQSAEAGLRAGEADVDNGTLPAIDSRGYWSDLLQPSATIPAPKYWDETDWANYALSSTDSLDYVRAEPSYVIEKVEYMVQPGQYGEGIDIGNVTSNMFSKEVYRITSRGVGATGTSAVVLESNFVPTNIGN